MILTDQPGPTSWPIAGATFILIHKQPKDPAAATEALKFFAWAYANGDKMAEELTTYHCRRMWSRKSKRSGRPKSKMQAESRSLRDGALTSTARDEKGAVGRLSVLPQSRVLDHPSPDSSQLMADVALPAQSIPTTSSSRAKALDRLRMGDVGFRILTRAAAITVLALLGAVILSLIDGSLPALRAFGLNFLIEERWNPVTEKFGALAPIYGTLVTSGIAMVIAVPLGLLVAVFLTELCPIWLRRPIGIAIELLAGIPSIIYGIWGLFVFAPFLQQTVQPFLITVFGPVPVLSSLFDGPPYGIGVLTAGLILAIMVLPFITSISRDVFDAVPPVLKEAAYGIGCTTWEVVRYVVVPYTRVGVIGGVMLGLGRALGETMAVTFVIGNAHRISASILAPGTTISATIANEFTEAIGDLYTSSLIALGLILFVITFIVLAAARYMLMRIERRVG